MPYLEYEDQGAMRRMELPMDSETFIGRDAQCAVCLRDIPQISRRHCVIYFNTNLNSYALADMHSTNGTKLNGVKISQNDVPLNDGDKIQIGETCLVFRGGTPQPEVTIVDPLTYAPAIPSVAPGMQNMYSENPTRNTVIDGMTVSAVLSGGEKTMHYLLTDNASPNRKTMKLFKIQQQDTAARGEFADIMDSLRAKALPATLLPYSGGGVRDDEHCFYTTEFQELPSLAAMISARAPAKEKKCLPVVYSIVETLASANQCGIFHGDLKPSQILYAQKASLLTGYGLAAWRRAHCPVQKTPWYASPELLSGKPLAWQSDMYSLGIIFFQMLTGVLPYYADSAEELTRMQIQDPLPFPGERNENVRITSITDGILRRMTMKDPKNRYSSWDEVLIQLGKANAILEEQEIQS